MCVHVCVLMFLCIRVYVYKDKYQRGWPAPGTRWTEVEDTAVVSTPHSQMNMSYHSPNNTGSQGLIASPLLKMLTTLIFKALVAQWHNRHQCGF